MKYRVTCAVNSATYIDGEFNVEVDDLVYTFTPDERGRLVRMSITAQVHDLEKFRSEIIENPRPGVKAHFIHRADKDLFDRIISEFQRLESHISFSFRLDAINWQNPKTETICESEQERDIAKILAAEINRTPRENPVKVAAEAMAKLIVGSRRYDRLTVPMSFYREGLNEYRAQRFITSFFNFYFIVEGLFGRGKTKNYHVEHEFKKSSGLRWAIEKTLENLAKEKPQIWKRLTDELTGAGRSVDVDGVIEHLVSVRGRLHHFTHNANRLEGTPFTDPAFEPVAELAFGLATFGILHFVVEINNGRDPVA